MMTIKRGLAPACAALAVLFAGVGSSVSAADAGTRPADKAAAKGGTVQVQGGTIGRMGEPARVDSDTFKFSEAETQLWQTNHLKNIKHPTRLYYEFQKSGSYEEGFTDSVYLDILHVNQDGTKDADLQFLTGDRQQPYGGNNVTHITGNPVLMMYLDGDIHEMNRLTHGSSQYFQRRIKMAFASSAKVEPTTVHYDGKDVKAEKITVLPYIDDPHISQLEQFAKKRYEFILSDDIPGTIYQIRTVVPAKEENAKQPLLEETLTLERVQVRS